MSEQVASPRAAVVQVPLESLESVLRSATRSAVRHALTGLPDTTRSILVNRTGEIEGLVLGRVVTSLAASGYIVREVR